MVDLEIYGKKSTRVLAFEECPFDCHGGGLSEDGSRTMLEGVADSILGGERGLVRQHMDDAASLGAEMIGYARSGIMRSSLENKNN